MNKAYQLYYKDKKLRTFGVSNRLINYDSLDLSYDDIETLIYSYCYCTGLYKPSRITNKVLMYFVSSLYNDCGYDTIFTEMIIKKCFKHFKEIEETLKAHNLDCIKDRKDIKIKYFG